MPEIEHTQFIYRMQRLQERMRIRSLCSRLSKETLTTNAITHRQHRVITDGNSFCGRRNYPRSQDRTYNLTSVPMSKGLIVPVSKEAEAEVFSTNLPDQYSRGTL